jgi:hypothetical protein
MLTNRPMLNVDRTALDERGIVVENVKGENLKASATFSHRHILSEVWRN